MKTGERLLVFLAGEHVADVSRARTGALSLEYTSTGRAASATPLSLALPVSPARYTDRRVTHFLDGLLPEHPGTRAAMARHFQIGTTDAFSLLHGAGLDCAGAVQFCTEDAADAIRRGGSLEPESDSVIEARLAEMEMDDAVSWVKRHEHWSLAGMQPKLALREEDGRWFTATGSEATTHILKPGVRGIAAQALDEHITLAAAARIGLECAESRWLEFKSQSAVVSTRYDRARRDGTVTRLHQEDLHQAIGMGRNKYDVDDSKEGVTSTDVLAVLRGYSISRDDEGVSVRAFVDSLIFSALTASTDGHAKNYSLLLEGERVRLAPLYDMASDLPYDTGPGKLALGIGGERSLSKIESSHWEALGREAGLSGEYVVDRVHEMADALPQAFAEAFADVGREAQQLRDRTMPRLAEHLDAAKQRATRARGLHTASSIGQATRPDTVWVSEHMRNGRVVAAHLRRRR